MACIRLHKEEEERRPAIRRGERAEGQSCGPAGCLAASLLSVEEAACLPACPVAPPPSSYLL